MANILCKSVVAVAVFSIFSVNTASAQTMPPFQPQGRFQSNPQPYSNFGTVNVYPGNPYQNYPPPPTRKAYVRVFVPDDRAKVTFDGQDTSSTGGSRLFETPPLEYGRSYTYTVKATWDVNGRPVTQERRVVVIPGQYAMANFMVPGQSEAIPLPAPTQY